MQHPEHDGRMIHEMPPDEIVLVAHTSALLRVVEEQDARIFQTARGEHKLACMDRDGAAFARFGFGGDDSTRQRIERKTAQGAMQ